jgi:urea transport system ATP-binding protein
MLEIERLNVYYGQSHILRDVTISVPPNRVVCLLGRNGAGKTTLLKTIMGLLPARQGRVLFGGSEITSDPPYDRARRGVGYVPQGREILSQLTVRENLLLAARNGSIPQPVFEWFPGLGALLDRRGGELSGGQQQQLALARAMICRACLLLLDEPTEGIQPSIISEIEDIIERMKREGGFSILLVEQYLEFAWRLADDYYIMEKGSIVAQGRTEELSENHARRYLAV